MRILVAAYMNPTSADYPLFLTDHWKALGHQVEVIPVDLELYNDPWFHVRHLLSGKAPRTFLDHLGKLVTRKTREFEPEIVLVIGHLLSARVLERISRRYGCTTGFLLDHNHLMLDDTIEIMRNAGFVIVHDTYVTPLIHGTSKGRNPNVFLMLGAADMREHRPVALSVEDKDAYGPNIAFVGGASPYRVDALSRLGALGLRIWGRPQEWLSAPHLVPCVSEEPVYGLKKTKIYNAAQLVLSLEDPEKQINSLNSRVPEVLACGGFVLCNWSKDLEDAGFRDGETVAWFHTLDEMQAKAEHYLRRPELRMEISSRGGELVRQTLTWERVAAELAEKMLAVRQTETSGKRPLH